MSSIIMMAAVFWVFASIGKRRRWGRGPFSQWGPQGAQWGPYGANGAYGLGGSPADVEKRRQDQENQDAVIEALESRVAHLEERLDFTERLLTGKGANELTDDRSRLSMARDPKTL